MSMVGSVCYEHVCEYCERAIEVDRRMVDPNPEAQAWVEGRINAFEEIIKRFKGEE